MANALLVCQDSHSEDLPLKFIDQEIVLDTETSFGADVPLAISSILLRRLAVTARPCVRMAIEGASSSVGATPGWLERAADVRTIGFSERNGHSILHVKAPRLGDAVPEVFDQFPLWPRSASSEDTAIQLIGQVSSVVRRQEAGSDMYDRPLLKHLANWQALFKQEVKELQIPGAPGGSIPVTLDMKVVENARILSAQVPTPRQVRVVGKLDMVCYSTRSFGLILKGGEEVRGVLVDGDPASLQQYLGKEITAFGKAIYRPSGSLLRIDTVEIADTTEGREAFSSVPEPLSHAPQIERKIQTSKGGVVAFFGTWPGDETDDQLLAALGELRN